MNFAGLTDSQSVHRYKLIDFWGIRKGARVLEIGCGQGYATKVLADAVGVNGFVYAIDNAQPEYGSPMTLNEAKEELLISSLGKRIHMEFKVNILNDDIQFKDNEFDFIVMSHCSWYLSSSDEFMRILEKVKPWGNKLCFAEWDITPILPEQVPHYVAASLQAHCECYKKPGTSDNNIRTLFSPIDIKKLITSSGWDIFDETTIFSPDLDDCRWEIMNLLSSDTQNFIKYCDAMPDKLKEFLYSQMELLNTYNIADTKPLCVYAVTAK
jgi:Predicted methyltransferase